jgi:hypothetical protein
MRTQHEDLVEKIHPLIAIIGCFSEPNNNIVGFRINTAHLRNFLLQAFPSIARLTPGKSLQARDDEVMPSVLDDGFGGVFRWAMLNIQVGERSTARVDAEIGR